MNPAPSASLYHYTTKADYINLMVKTLYCVIHGTELPPANSFSMIKPH